eukprot:703790-Rhodomonas_salina.1
MCTRRRRCRSGALRRAPTQPDPRRSSTALSSTPPPANSTQSRSARFLVLRARFLFLRLFAGWLACLHACWLACLLVCLSACLLVGWLPGWVACLLARPPALSLPLPLLSQTSALKAASQDRRAVQCACGNP